MSALYAPAAPPHHWDDAVHDRPHASLHEEGRREAEKYKWIESERHGRDLGDMAIRDWYHQHWLRYCIHGRLEHICGRKRWREFDDQAFGCVYSLIVENDLLTDRLLDRIDAGYENLGLINWAHEWGLPMERVLQILEMIDVNLARIEPLV